MSQGKAIWLNNVQLRKLSYKKPVNTAEFLTLVFFAIEII